MFLTWEEYLGDEVFFVFTLVVKLGIRILTEVLRGVGYVFVIGLGTVYGIVKEVLIVEYWLWFGCVYIENFGREVVIFTL